MNQHSPPRNLADAIQVCFTKYGDFRGKAGRSEYWWFVLFAWALPLVVSYVFRPFTPLVTLVVLLPLLAVQARRLHDINKSAWWLLLLFIPVIGILILLFWSTEDSATVF